MLVAVGLVLATDQDPGTFDTLHDGPIVSVPPGPNACAV
jgi:hypothetical protein